MKRMSYREAVAWIALNDEPMMNGLEDVASLISVCLIADLSEIEPEKVAADVIRYRKKEDA